MAFGPAGWAIIAFIGVISTIVATHLLRKAPEKIAEEGEKIVEAIVETVSADEQTPE